ncbi:transposase, partial [Labilibaculum filiforme]
GQDRTQTHLFPISLDQSIAKDNEVRLIDLFVDSIDLNDFGFKVDFQENGRPAYRPSDLLKLYIYGYLNRTRSSRGLEKESKRNIEVMWLLRCLSPDHNTISNFRRDNPKAIKKVFRQTVQLAKYFNLIGGNLLAGDSTKLRAQNSKKNNFNQKKVERHLAYIENKLSEYENALAESDGDEKKTILQEIEKQTDRKKEYQNIERQIKQTGQPQISTSDSDSRQMITRNNITEVAYNIQTTVDAENNIPIDYKVTNANDSKAMGNMLQRAKSILRSNQFTALYDKGYHTGSEFSIADRLGIETIVAIPGVAAQAPNPLYNVENFRYNKQEDYYTCPQNQKLKTNGKWHKARTYLFKRYTTKACANCSVKNQCSKAKCGKAIQRSEHQDLIDKNRQRVNQNQSYYKRRQAIVEHPYGTIKRQWGFDHIMTKKGMTRASSDVGLLMTAYNLRRLINIVGIKALIKWAKQLLSYFLELMELLGLKLAKIRTWFLSENK